MEGGRIQQRGEIMYGSSASRGSRTAPRAEIFLVKYVFIKGRGHPNVIRNLPRRIRPCLRTFNFVPSENSFDHPKQGSLMTPR